MVSHASNPVASRLSGDMYRIFFSCRDANRRSHIGYVDIDLKSPLEVLSISKSPVLKPGEIGTFDDSGVTLACINKIGERQYLYYLGWNLSVTVPWRNSIGLAVADSIDGTFEKYSKAPIIDRSHVDPYSLSYPFVLEDDGVFKMWYGSNLKWGRQKNDMLHVIKYAESGNGINWIRRGAVAIDLKKGEVGLSRPCVRKELNRYRMWYSIRTDSYRVGYAESLNGIDWTRMDEQAGIDTSETDWENHSIAYPSIFEHQGQTYLLYNGNDFGKTGFGLAVADEI